MTTPAGERRPDPLRAIHGLLFAVAVAAALVDLASSSGFVGSILGGALSVPLVGLALGMAHVGIGRLGGRPLIVVADLVMIIGAAAGAYGAVSGPFVSPGLAVPAVVVGGLATFALLVALRTPPGPVPQGPPRTLAHRVAVVALFAFAVITVIAPYAAIGDLPVASIVLLGAPWIAGVVVALTAWWYGSGWLLALFGIGTLASSLDVVLALTVPPSWNHLILGIGATVMSLRATPTGSRGPESSADAGVDDVPPSWRRRRPTAAAIWAILGAVLFVPTALLGRWVPGFVDCFEGCPPLSPLAEPTVLLTWLAVVLVPLAAIAVALEPRSRPGASAWTALIGLVGAAVVLGQVALGLTGIAPFTYMTIGAPAAVLCAVGFATALAAPRWLVGTGRVAAAGSALAGLLWMATGLGSGGGYVDLPLVGVVSLVSGAVVVVALGRAFGERTVEKPETTASTPPGLSAAALGPS